MCVAYRPVASPLAGSWVTSHKSSQKSKLEWLPSIEDRRQTDRVTAPTRAGLRRWPFAAPTRSSRWRHSGYDLLLRPSINTHRDPKTLLFFSFYWRRQHSRGFEIMRCVNLGLVLTSTLHSPLTLTFDPRRAIEQRQFRRRWVNFKVFDLLQAFQLELFVQMCSTAFGMISADRTRRAVPLW